MVNVNTRNKKISKGKQNDRPRCNKKEEQESLLLEVKHTYREDDNHKWMQDVCTGYMRIRKPMMLSFW